MNRHQWQLDGLAFTTALEVIGRDRPPHPLSYRPEFTEHRADYERRRQRTAQQLQQIFDENLYNALTILLQPKVRIEIEGLHGQRHEQVVRIHAGIVDGHATLAVQHPGPTREHGGDVTITRHRSTTLASEIIGLLPQQQGGSQRRFHAKRSDLEAPIYARHPTRLSPQEHMQQFFRRPRIGTGEITVYPGYTLDARPTNDGLAFIWLDYPRDGRYLLHNHNTDDLTVTPGPHEEMLRQLQGRIDQVSRKKPGMADSA